MGLAPDGPELSNRRATRPCEGVGAERARAARRGAHRHRPDESRAIPARSVRRHPQSQRIGVDSPPGRARVAPPSAHLGAREPARRRGEGVRGGPEESGSSGAHDPRPPRSRGGGEGRPPSDRRGCRLFRWFGRPQSGNEGARADRLEMRSPRGGRVGSFEVRGRAAAPAGTPPAVRPDSRPVHPRVLDGPRRRTCRKNAPTSLSGTLPLGALPQRREDRPNSQGKGEGDLGNAGRERLPKGPPSPGGDLDPGLRRGLVSFLPTIPP